MNVAVQQLGLMERLGADLARGTADLPVLPAAAMEALRLAQKPEMNFAEVVRGVEVEPPLAARILAHVNSPLYSRGVPIASLQQALARMGVQATRDILYMAVYGSALFDTPRYQARVRRVFDRGVLIGRAARELAGSVEDQKLDPDLGFLAGLLHDIGRTRCLKLIAGYAERAPDTEVKTAVEALHARAGAELVTAWRLPPELGEVCLHHLDPEEDQSLARLVQLADLLVRSVAEADYSGKRRAKLREGLDWLGVPREQMPRIRRSVRDDQAAAQRSA
ncbi:MAG: HDOD domain-containing protein [Deltaproteobacteria bacterium]|nr:HDOD domain-containing protein [Deltaproteobacteria bacterium]